MTRYQRAGLGLLSALIAVLTLGCGTSGGGLDVGIAVETNGGTTWVLIGVVNGMEPASATVTVNGDVFVVDFLEFAPLTTPVSAGGLVSVQVSSSEGSGSASLIMPALPSAIDPDGSVPVDPASAIAMTWTPEAPNPEQYIVRAEDTVSADGYEALESGTATGHTIPANTLTASVTDSKVIVGATSTTSLGGDVSSLSELTVVNSVNILLDT